MALKTPEEYRESLKSLNPRVFIFGEEIENFSEHPLFKGSINAVALTYELALDPEYAPLFTTDSNVVDEKINRYASIHCSIEDLVEKVKLIRLMAEKTGECPQRCMGWDALNSVYSVTYDVDQKYNTEYHKRFIEYLKYIHKNDLMVHGTMTDPRGDRSLKPAEQKDPDLYLRVVEKRKDGIIVRGAKGHQGGILNHHELLVMPCASMRKEDADHAVSFALPIDTKGITYVFGRHSMDTRAMEDTDFDRGNTKYGRYAMWLFFDDVFVPWERVFLCGEYEFAGDMVENFAGLHRQNYGACRAGAQDVLIGAAALVAEYNGLAKNSVIKDKILEMIALNETLYQGSIACSSQGYQTPSGVCLMNKLLAYVTKYNVCKIPYEISRITQDIAGGLFATMPSEKDYRHPEVGPFIEKYLKGKDGIPTEHRMRIMRLIEHMTLGRALPVCMHGGGSPAAQKLMIGRYSDMEHKKKLAKNLAGIPIE